MEPRKCRKCPNTSDKVGFVKGKNLCNPCKAKEARTRREVDNPDADTGRPARTIELDLVELPPIDKSKFNFEDRGTLNTALSDTLSENLGAISSRLTLNIARLNAAIKSKRATDLEKAEVALGRTIDSQSAMLMKVIDKLELLEGLRRDGEADGKDVEFVETEADEAVNVIDVAPYEEANGDGGA